MMENERIEKLLANGEKTLADFFIENDRPIYREKIFEDIADFVKKKDIKQLL